MSLMSRNLLLMALMLVAALAAPMMQATTRMADKLPPIDLETMVPRAFGDWAELTNSAQLLVDPEVEAELESLYGQTLGRTYVNKDGDRVMLSISYGANQASDDFQVHRPEYCYTSQGFQVKGYLKEVLSYRQGSIPLQRLEATQGRRHEPISYWITIGSEATLPGLSRKVLQLSHGLIGQIPDGMLVRVSSISPDARQQYQIHDQFIKAMLDAVEPGLRPRMAGDV